MKKETKRLIIGASLVATGTVAAVITAKALLDGLVAEALDREEPKAMQRTKGRLMRSYFESDIAKKVAEQGEVLGGSVTETVSINSFDGTKLIGHVYRAPNPKRFILAMHGWRSTWKSDFGVISSFWHNNDCSVLYVEQRGQGESDGKHMGFGMIERFDCIEWVNWLEENGAKDLPIFLAGISMGASTVLMASGSPELPENVHGIIADCGFTSAKAIWKHVTENNFRLPYAVFGNDVDALCRRRLNMESDAYSTLDAMKVNTRPILFVHGSGDSFVPVEMTYENYAACKAPKKLLISEGSEHGMSYVDSREEYEKMIKEFWNEFD